MEWVDAIINDSTLPAEEVTVILLRNGHSDLSATSQAMIQSLEKYITDPTPTSPPTPPETCVPHFDRLVRAINIAHCGLPVIAEEGSKEGSGDADPGVLKGWDRGLIRVAKKCVQSLISAIANDVVPVTHVLPWVSLPPSSHPRGGILLSVTAEAYVATLDDYLDDLIASLPDVWIDRILRGLGARFVVDMETKLFAQDSLSWWHSTAATPSSSNSKSSSADPHAQADPDAEEGYAWKSKVGQVWVDLWAVRDVYARILRPSKVEAMFDRMLVVVDVLGSCLGAQDKGGVASSLKRALRTLVLVWEEDVTFAHVVHLLTCLQHQVDDEIRESAQKAAFKAIVHGLPDSFQRSPYALPPLLPSLFPPPGPSTANRGVVGQAVHPDPDGWVSALDVLDVVGEDPGRVGDFDGNRAGSLSASSSSSSSSSLTSLDSHEWSSSLTS